MIMNSSINIHKLIQLTVNEDDIDHDDHESRYRSSRFIDFCMSLTVLEEVSSKVSECSPG